MTENVFKLRFWISEIMPSDAKPMSDLQQEFDELERAVRETIGLLEEVDGQKYWLIMFRRALLSIEAKELASHFKHNQSSSECSLFMKSFPPKFSYKHEWQYSNLQLSEEQR